MEEIEDLGDLYALLSVSTEATDKEIEKAYRTQSLKVHPDRNPDDKNAAEKFDRLTRAKEFLLKPSKRGLYDEKRKAETARVRRFQELDAKSQKMRQDLERREKEAEEASKRRAREKFMPKASEVITADFERELETRRERKRVQQELSEMKLRQQVSKFSRVLIVLRPDPVETLNVGERIYQVLAKKKLIKVTIDEHSAELLFENRECALEAVLLLKTQKEELGFFKKVILEDPEKLSSSDALDELEQLAKEKIKTKDQSSTSARTTSAAKASQTSSARAPLGADTTFPLPQKTTMAQGTKARWGQNGMSRVRRSPSPCRAEAVKRIKLASPVVRNQANVTKSADLLAELDAMLL